VDYEAILARADEEILQAIIGHPVVRLLNLLDPALSSPASLRKLTMELWTPEEVLRRPRVRDLLTDLLPPVEAMKLVGALRLSAADPYGALRAMRLARGSVMERRFFEALSVRLVEETPEDSSPASEEVTPHYPLFPHQRRAVEQVGSILDGPDRRVLLHMPTGAGKTRTAMNLVATMLRANSHGLVVWLAYSEELCEQSAEEFRRAWRQLGDRPIGLYRYWGPRDLGIDQLTDGFLVAGLGKVYQRGLRDASFLLRLADRSILVIIDEAHQAIAQTYRFVLEVLVERSLKSRLLGLTATPGRTWNDPDQDQQLADFFHRQKVTLQIDGYSNPVDFLIAEGYLARPDFQSLTYGGGPELTDRDKAEIVASLDIPGRILERLAADEQRNLLIVQRTEQLAKSHERILVFAATVEHAKVLAAVLQARGCEAYAVTAMTSRSERRELIARFRADTSSPMVMCNFGVLTAGFDAPRTSAAIIARPTKSLVLYSQMVGRATRGPLAGGNAEATIATVVDTNLPGFGQLSEAFMNWEDVW
jgi:DNA repair protein RadD